MDTRWVDINEVPFVHGWHCMRSAQMSTEGVGTVITLTLLDTNENQHMFVMPLEVAQRAGWDMMGEGGGYFAELVTGYESVGDGNDGDDGV